MLERNMRRWYLPLALLAGGGLLIVALQIYISSSDREMRSQLFIPRPSKMTPELALLQQYVRIDTSNPPGNELPGARFLAGVLEKNGIHAEIIESAPRRASVYARIAGRQRGDGLLLFNHIDVVPATNAGWTRPPFAAEVFLNQMFGRGSLDMKGIAICELLAFIDVARTHRTPERDIVFLAVADEEAGGKLGTAWLLEHRPDVFAGVRYALNEGGITETSQERISYFGIEIGTKMTVRLRLRARDRQSMQALRIALEPFIARIDADRVLPEVREFLHDLAPIRIEQGQFLDDIGRTIAAGKLWLVPAGYRELTQNVLWPESVESDARGATMQVKLFNLPDENPDTRIDWLRSVAARYGVSIEEVLEKNGPAPLSSRHTPMFALLSAEVKRQYGGVRTGTEVLAAWSNDSRYLRARGIDAYGLMPFPTDWNQTQGIHSIDERLWADLFTSGVALLRHVTGRFAFERLPPSTP
ncbi:MAG TPA: M20/M25/M40 family metallo-hydrolase [Thermoanaerobaculia bacterium]